MEALRTRGPLMFALLLCAPLCFCCCCAQAAGILCYRTTLVGDEPQLQLLLGLERGGDSEKKKHKIGQLCVIGGKKESIDGDDCIATALREFGEETANCCTDPSFTTQSLKTSCHSNPVFYSADSKYVLFFHEMANEPQRQIDVSYETIVTPEAELEKLCW